MKLGGKLKHIRQENNLSMDALVELFRNKENLNVIKSMISRWENSLAVPTIQYLSAYAKCFKLDLNELMDLPITIEKPKYMSIALIK